MSLNIPLFIVGDFNCNLLNINDTGAKTLLNLCNTFNLTQLIESSTRITETSESLIDVMLASNKNLISKTSVLANSISDHDLILASLNLEKPRPKPTYISTRSFKNFKKDAFLANISGAPWSLIDIVEDTEDKLDTFNSLFYQILDQRAPVKIIKQRARPNSFINDNIRSLTRTRDYWQWLARQTNDSAIWSGYRNFKGEVKREIRLAQREFVEEQIKQNPNDVGSIWKTIRSWITKKPANIKSFTKDDQTVANDFNRFLSSIGKFTMEKTQLARKFNYMPAQVPCTPKKFSFNTAECS